MPPSAPTSQRARNLDSTATDWAICLVRWGLLCLILLLALVDPTHRLPLEVTLTYVLGVASYNLVITVLLALRLFPGTIPAFTLVADTATVFLLLVLSRQSPDLFFFVPLFPILVSSLRFGWHVGLTSAIVFILIYELLTIFTPQPGEMASRLFRAGQYAVLYLVAALVPGVVPWWPAGLHSRPEKMAVPEHLKMIYEMAASLSATLNYERVLEAILDISRLGLADLGERIGESAGIVLLNDKNGLFPASSRNLLVRDDENRHISGTSGIVDQAISSGQAVIGKRPASDPELKEFESLAACQSMICIPLRAGFETYGVVLFASIHRDAYTRQHIDLLTIFCNQATIALQNASLYRSLREERDKIVDKEEQARRKLARDLHDGPTQDIAAIAMRLNFARMLLDRDTGRARAELERLEDLAHRTVKEIRSMLFTLRPVMLETEGLVAALEHYAETIQQNDNLPVVIEAEQYRDCLDTEAQSVVFSILEEAINNAKKHAQASRVCVRLSVRNDLFVAIVEDNGRGFDVQAVEQSYSSRGSLGILNLKERASLIEGTLNIESVPGQGTQVALLVPIPSDVE